MKYNHLRRYRRRSMFTQSEIAFLLNIESEPIISRFEKARQLPRLQIIFGYQAIFDVPAHELFPRLYQETTNCVVERSHMLIEKLKTDPDNPHFGRKVQILNILASK